MVFISIVYAKGTDASLFVLIFQVTVHMHRVSHALLHKVDSFNSGAGV